jgi:hypothetical protein
MKALIPLLLIATQFFARAEDLRLSSGQALRDVTITRFTEDGVWVQPNRFGANVTKYPWNLFAGDEAAKLKARGQQQAAAAEKERTGGLKKFAKLTVAQVAASPFTLEGVLIELTGIREVEPQEVEKGVYQLTIRSMDYSARLEATASFDVAAIAEKSGTLFVTIIEADKFRTKVKLLGNVGRIEGFSEIPTVSWSK